MTDSILYKIIICILAGAGAGIGTGFAGLSAAAFISPMLVAFLDVPIYEAVAIALASDVLASAVSAYTYAREKRVDMKRGKFLLIAVIVFTIVGSAVAYFVSSTTVGDTALGYWSIIGSLLLGINFLIKGRKNKESRGLPKKVNPIAATILCGAIVGFICGFQGAGGGLMMLFVLTSVLAYEMKTAVGTSVFIMTFTALLGALIHFFVKGTVPDWLMLGTCILSTLICARVASVIANRISSAEQKIATGILLTVSGLAMLVVKIFF